MKCNDCNDKGYIDRFDSSHDMNVREPCWSCESEKQHEQELIQKVSKLIVNTSPQRLALLVAENIVKNAHIMDREYSYLEQYIVAKQKESLLLYANTVC